MIRLILISMSFLIIFGNLFAQGGGSALNFDGSDDIVICGTDSSLDIQEALTIEVWIKGNPSQTTYARIVDKYYFHSREGYSLNRSGNTASTMLDIWATDGTKHPYVGVTPTYNEQWHYVAATFNGDTIKIYIDGRLEKTGALSDKKSIRLCSKYLSLGNGYDGATWFPYRGFIDEVRLWNTAIDSATIKDWMHKGISIDHPDFSNLVGHWKFDEGEGSIASDSSGSGNDGILTNIDTTSSWINSHIPIAGSFANQLKNVSAVWISVDSSFSSILSVNDTNIVEENCVIFGHDAGDLSWSSADIPDNFNILYRINRIWRTEVYDTVTGNIIFDVSGLGILEGNGLRLLIDSDGNFSNADTAHGIYDSANELFVISDQSFQHGYYYTLGTEENISSIEYDSHLLHPKTLTLSQNYPNPFNPHTQFIYSLPSNSHIEISLYNIRGQKVEILYKGYQLAGNHIIKIKGNQLSSGVYLYEIKTSTEVKRRKCILLK